LKDLVDRIIEKIKDFLTPPAPLEPIPVRVRPRGR
jgi:hypothetical protein